MKGFMVLFLGMMLIFVSCGKNAGENLKKTDVKIYSIDDLMSDGFEYKNNEIIVEGLCIHVCQHSGKKMFISGKNSENKLQIFTSDKIAVFDKNFEGSNLRVKGTLEEEKIDLNAVKIMEDELKEPSNQSTESCSMEEGMKKIQSLKDRIIKSKKGYISKYTMTGFEVTKI